MKKIVISWICCVLAGLMLFAWLGRDLVQLHNEPSSGSGTLIRGDFNLTRGDGTSVTQRDLNGRYMLVYFGFTRCPSICPTALLLMQNTLSHLGDKASKIQPIFISLDPERDTPKIASDYAAHFGPTMLGLSGTPEQIKEAADHFKVYYTKVDDTDSALGYVIDHSGFIYLMDPEGRYLTHFANNVSEREMEEGINRYVR